MCTSHDSRVRVEKKLLGSCHRSAQISTAKRYSTRHDRAMDQLPAEILLDIVDHIYHSRVLLAPLTTISKKWCDIIETKTMRNIRLRSDRESLRQFEAIFSSPGRSYLLKELKYEVLLPKISEKRFLKLQSQQEASRTMRRSRVP